MTTFKFDLQRFGAPSPNDLLVGAGKVFFNRWENGNKTVFRHLGNVPEFKLTPNVEKITKYSSMDAAKEVYAEAVKSMGYTPSMTLDEFNPFNLALGLYGDEGIEVQAEQSIVNEAHTVTRGAALSTGYKNIKDIQITPVQAIAAQVGAAVSFIQSGTPGSATVTSGGTYIGTTNDAYYVEIVTPNSVSGTITDAEFTWKKGLAGDACAPITVTGSAQTLAEGVTITFTAGSSGQDLEDGEIYKIEVTAASTAYVAGRDYLLDATVQRGGLVMIPDTSNIPDNTQVLVSYTVPAGQYPKIMGGISKKIEGELLFIGDPKQGRPYTLEIWHVTLNPTGDIGLITDEWGSFTIEMTVMADRVNHPTEPFFKATNV